MPTVSFMTRAMSLVLVQLLFFGRGAARADSSVLYVALAGSDQNPCTIALPCASLDRATTLAQPLDTVEVASGVYGPQHIYAAGAPDNPITITADGPVTITANPQPYCLLCIWDHSHDVTIHGFTVLGHPVDPTTYGTPRFPLDNLGAIMVRSQRGRVTVDGNTVLDSPATCIKAGSPSTTVSNNYVSGCGSDSWTHGIYIAGPDATVVNNIVARVPGGFGIHVWGSDIGGAQIISNTVRDLSTPWAAIVVGGGGTTGTVISSNELDINSQQRAAIMLYGGPYTITDNIVMALDASPTFTFIKYGDRSSDGTPPGPYVVRDNMVYTQAVTRTSTHTW